MKVKANLIELEKKTNPYNESEKIFWNGENNMYSEEMERVVSNSPTGSRAREMFGKYIFGKGIPEAQNTTFPNGVLLAEVAKDVVDDIPTQYGSFIHTNFRVDIVNDEVTFIPFQPKSLNYNKCRIEDRDDDGNDGMIVYKNWRKYDKEITKKEKNYEKKYYPFNNNQEVIKAQVRADAIEKNVVVVEGEENWSELIKHYRGQVMYLNLTPKLRYATSKFDPVFLDLDTEFRIAYYTNTSTKDGFLGKLAIVTQGLDKEGSEEINEIVKGWLGPEGTSNIAHFDVEQAEDLDKVLKVIQVPSQYNEKQFEITRKAMRINILGAANNLPEELAFNNGSSMFDGSEKYRELKKFYWEQCEWERQKVEEAFFKLGHNFNFIPLNDELEETTAETEENVNSTK